METGRAAATKLGQGSVLAIPLDEEHWALSQILVPGATFWLGAAPMVFKGLPRVGEIQGLPLSVLSWTNDAEVYRGNWVSLGAWPLQGPPSPAVEYKVGFAGKMWVESFTGERLRELDPDRDADLTFRKSRSPLLVQDMVRDACGFRSPA
ncbi:MAG: hypothetical protein QME55_13310 [Brevundimonas sp.]|uniref:hypothetical protein n=1 Tax=Brevundimonas sp. TaxID=1871086 RepID=UPI0026318F96|nr:hypothetical protein [Brevundimonas sp.]MDI6625703.1 hypothetical protein [Brevundimonas sp.]MDQ7813591.1 hypothetical protein [Brevundimonas sp.]